MTRTANNEEVKGPYWIRIASDGAHQVCGRHGKVIRTYRPELGALAEADLRRLQKQTLRAQRLLLDAAPDLYEAIEGMLRWRLPHDRAFTVTDGSRKAFDRLEAALAKASGDREPA